MNWRLLPYIAVGAFVLWLGMGTIDEVEDAYNAVCVATAPGLPCRGINLGALRLITLAASLTLPWALWHFFTHDHPFS